MDFNFPNADTRGKYFIPQSGASTSRSGLMNGNARRIRAATTTGVSTSSVDKSSTPRIMLFPGSPASTAQSSEHWAVSIEICCTGESARRSRNRYAAGRPGTRAAYPKHMCKAVVPWTPSNAHIYSARIVRSTMEGRGRSVRISRERTAVEFESLANVWIAAVAMYIPTIQMFTNP